MADLAFVELQSLNGGRLLELGLRLLELDEDGIEEVLALGQKYRGPKRADLASLVNCKREGVSLLTGDASLRKAAENEGVEVHGLIWILDQLVQMGCLAKKQAALSLGKIVAANDRLPKGEIRHRLRIWDD